MGETDTQIWALTQTRRGKGGLSKPWAGPVPDAQLVTLPAWKQEDEQVPTVPFGLAKETSHQVTPAGSPPPAL